MPRRIVLSIAQIRGLSSIRVFIHKAPILWILHRWLKPVAGQSDSWVSLIYLCLLNVLGLCIFQKPGNLTGWPFVIIRAWWYLRFRANLTHVNMPQKLLCIDPNIHACSIIWATTKGLVEKQKCHCGKGVYLKFYFRPSVTWVTCRPGCTEEVNQVIILNLISGVELSAMPRHQSLKDKWLCQANHDRRHFSGSIFFWNGALKRVRPCECCAGTGQGWVSIVR